MQIKIKIIHEIEMKCIKIILFLLYMRKLFITLHINKYEFLSRFKYVIRKNKKSKLY